jgi:Tfp pilus assembly protein PilX
MNKPNEKGIALILTLILVLVMSVMAVSLMFLSQTETWSSMNYRLMSQARDGAEAGVNATANYLVNTYVPPTGTTLTTAYNSNVSPVQAPNTSTSGNDVILSASALKTANYPDSTIKSAFSTAGQGSLTAGYATVNYSSYAKLLNQQAVVPYGTVTPVTVQTWQITSDAAISGVRTADEEVSAILERQITPVFTYAAFASDNGCSALTFGGGGTTDSYDSNTVVAGAVATQAYGGNVGTNGNLATNGNPTTINGNLSTPRTGVGVCTAGNVTAWTSGSGHVTGTILELPQPVTYPLPVIPSPGTLDLSLGHNATCPTGVNAITGCTASGGDIYIPPGSYRNINITGNETVHVSAGIYNINSFQEQSAQSSLVIDSGPVIFQVTGTNVTGSVVDLTGNSVQNATLNPMNFQMRYAGTGSVSLKGNSQASGLLYAPLATFSFAGQADWYGAVIGASLTDMGGAAIHYDRRLGGTAYTISNYMLDSFTWQKY